MRRGLIIGTSLYLAAAAIGHAAERAGRTRCDCRPDCWCKRPGVSAFRWVFPFGHRVG